VLEAKKRELHSIGDMRTVFVNQGDWGLIEMLLADLSRAPATPDPRIDAAEPSQLRICRNCTLSGELHVGLQSELCEVCDCSEPYTMMALQEAVKCRVNEAVKAEREACAKIADRRAEISMLGERTWAGNEGRMMCEMVADAIRLRSEKEAG
jgi:hypothetical protein